MAEMPVGVRLRMLEGLLKSCGGPALGRFDGRFHRIDEGTEDAKTADSLFALCRRGVRLEKKLSEEKEPLLFTGRIGLVWLLCPVTEEKELVRIYGIGPFLPAERSTFELDNVLANVGAPLSLRGDASVLLRKLPLIPFAKAQEYAAMLHYALWEEKLDLSRLRLLSGGNAPTNVRRTILLDDRQAYGAEQETLRRVREGDLSLIEQTDRVALGDAVLRPGPWGDQLTQMKSAALCRLSLLSRAAMEGGLSPETGLALFDRYAQSVTAATVPGELLALLMAMQEEFVRRVNAVRTERMSREIEAVCGYIERHLEEPLSIEALSRQTGYTEYYFSRKFKRESGLTPAAYIRKKRLEKAAVLLLTTGQDVGQIAESLQFCSASYFTASFRRQYGLSPIQYRKRSMP